MDNSVHILYAEDDSLLRDTYKRHLESFGFTVHAVENGNEAWEQYQGRKWDLILLDMGMPGKSGMEVLKLIRAVDDDIPIIILSIDDWYSAFSEGADDFVPKKEPVEVLKARIDKALKAYIKYMGKRNHRYIHLSHLIMYDTREKILTVNGKAHPLKSTKGKLFSLFCQRINEPLFPEDICHQMWDGHDHIKENELRTYISQLRKLLKPDHSIELRKDYGGAYMLIAPEE